MKHPIEFFAGFCFQSPVQQQRGGCVTLVLLINSGVPNPSLAHSSGAIPFTLFLLWWNCLQIGLDGVRMLDPSTSRTLRIYPLETIARWEVSILS
jgi:hypothetical protein